jgi:hypothetical protein
MKRKFGGEFLEYLSHNDKICSYCAEDDQYTEWLEKELEKERSKIRNIRIVISDEM